MSFSSFLIGLFSQMTNCPMFGSIVKLPRVG
jgi:hypothetical protein